MWPEGAEDDSTVYSVPVQASIQFEPGTVYISAMLWDLIWNDWGSEPGFFQQSHVESALIAFCRSYALQRRHWSRFEAAERWKELTGRRLYYKIWDALVRVKKRCLGGDRWCWLVTVYNISVFGVGHVNKMVTKLVAIPHYSRQAHSICLYPGLQSQSWPYPARAMRTLLPVTYLWRRFTTVVIKKE